MTLSKRRLAVLFAIAVLLVATQGAVARTIEIGSIRGWLGPGNELDVYDAGLASNWITTTAKLVVFPDRGLDIITCLFLIMPGPNSTPRQLGCMDGSGKGGSETVREYISGGDFPNSAWRFNAHLVLVAMRYGGSGNYSGKLYVIL